MSGFGGIGGPPFGGPFGSQQQQQQPSFGTTTPAPALFGAGTSTTTPIGGGFGFGGGRGFGAPAPAAPSIFGGGVGGASAAAPVFGAAATTFGGSTFGAASSTFGNSSNTNTSAATAAPALTFGSSPNVWNNNNTAQIPSQQQQLPSFGSSVAFGNSSSIIGFGGASNTAAAATSAITSGGFAFGTSSGFGSTSAAVPATPAPFFGSSASGGNTSFGGGPFGSSTTGGLQSSNPVPPPPLFGSSFATSSMPFGGSGSSSTIHNPAPASLLTVPNPFGSAAAVQQQSSATTAAPLLSFGMSANVATDGDNNNNNMMAGGGSLSPTPFFGASGTGGGGGGFGVVGGGGGMSPFGSPMQQHSDNEDMGFGDDLNNSNYYSNNQFSSNLLPFGTPFATATAGASSSTWPPPAPFGSNHQNSLSPIPEDEMAGGGADASPVPLSSDNDNNNDMPSSAEQNELAKLKAKIEQKKKRLEEKRRKDLAKAQAAASAAVASGGGGRSSLNASAPSFTPSFAGHHHQQQDSGDFKQYKDRNEEKMAKTRSQLPSDLQELADQSTDYAALTTSATGNREDLANAVSLVGKCLYMCPDEELLRRQREGDIQLLETPLPEILHPPGWTLRDTAVKRFRRSAADYKLDVPEWIRPPDVLEKVCGYLEEWIMERDRQGPDPRWPGGASPPPLDVYQFIWDRTRMVRKDFILQNYVGTGGNCDARAVRCHERIARWHAMCEHQLSHIPEFVTHQSQQNIQELGQTMKTLNQYYDDALGRSRVEVPDEAGNETRTVTRGFSHGCSCDIVQGQDPVDFNRSPLANNTESIERRLIGNSANHGTAEAEMRGLYMLLTIDNDGGMEVLKYAAQLHRERPDIYQSRQVQLALSIYKAKKEDNYARFFRILRSSSTPYLFACIMFKHVEYMRKHAIFVMSRTFGGKTKDTNEAMYDHYPLKELIRLLCFEDAEEAMTALQHYNITFKEMKMRTSSNQTKSEYFVFWKRSSFKEARHPEKGFALPLYPKKMMRTIESKLNGATRLAVCRGELSEVVPQARGSYGGDSAVGASPVAQEADSLDAEALLAQQRDEEEREKVEAARLAEEERLRRQQAKMEERRLAQESQQRAIAEKKLREEEERQKQHELELEQQRQQTAREEAELQARQERMRQLEIERQEAERKRAEDEERQRWIELERQETERNRAEEERKQKFERERQEAERRRIEEEQRREEAELAQRRRLQEEARQKELARLEQERIEQEAQERRETLEWDERIRKATTSLLWRRLKRRLPRHLQVMSDAQASIRRLGSPAPAIYQMVLDQAVSSMAAPPMCRDPPVASLKIVIDRLLRHEVKRKSLASMLLPTFSGRRPGLPSLDDEKSSFLFKIAIILPESDNSHDQSLCAVIREWIAVRLGGFDRVDIAASNRCRVGLVIVDGNDPECRDSCDASLVVIPLSLYHGIDESIHSLMHILDDDTPRVFLALSQRFDEGLEQAGQDIEDSLSGSFDDVAVRSNSELSEEAVEESLLTASDDVLSALANTSPKVINQVPLEQLCLRCISETLWQPDHINRRDDVVTLAKDTIACMVDELDATGNMAQSKWAWPPAEFADETGSVVKDYFGASMHLPMDWTSSLLRRNVEPSVGQLQNRIDGTLPEAIRNLLTSAPQGVQEECRLLLDNRCFRRCLQRALLWKSENQEPWQNESYVYIPRNLVRGIVQKIAAAMKAAARPTTIRRRPSSLAGEMWDERNSFGGPVDGDFLETIDLPPTESPLTQSQPALQEAYVLESRNVASSKRSRMATDEVAIELSSQPQAANNMNATAKRGIRADDDDDDDTNNKRRRRTRPNSHSKRRRSTGSSRALDESKSFTERLQAMVAGDVLYDRMIGNQSLSVLLRNSDIILPDTEP